ncbi:MAG TPA: hypothetical protein GX503_00050 [Clostridiales bacterium]|nr:hypothetical protein [Clostridiales bacterium]
MDDIKKLENQIEEEVLAFALQPRFEKEIQKAKECFYKEKSDIGSSAEMYADFNSWLIYDYRLENGKTIFEEYLEVHQDQFTQEEKDFALQQCSSYLSIYELKEVESGQALLQDIFTRDKLNIQIQSADINAMEIGDLVLARSIYFNGQAQLIDVKGVIPGFFKNAIEKSFIPKYEEYKNKERYGNWNHFLKQNSLLLMKHIEIVMRLVEEEQEDDGRYDVWQSVYFVKYFQKVREIFMEHSEFKLDFEEDGVFYFKWYDEEDSLSAEIVLKPNFLEIECISEEDREKAKKNMEYLLGDFVKYYKDEIVGLYDIL